MLHASQIRLTTSFLALAVLLASPCQTRAADDAPRKVTAKDMPRIRHTEPDKALQTFQVARGFQLEIVAAEPLVSDPVDACFDENGRLFVAEMHGYPFSQEPTKLNPAGGGKKNAGIIRLLEDTDGDGRMDKSTVFADGISWPTSVRCYNGGVFVIAPQFLYYFKDTNGDNKADIKNVVLSGFGRDNVQSVTNGLQWGLDNKLYFAAGRNPKQLTHRGKQLFPVSGADLRFDPKTERFELITGGLQFGHTMDDWGTRFVCSNSNHIQQVVFPQEYLARNPFLAAAGSIRSIAADGSAARVFRISPPEPWRIIRQRWRAAAKGYKLVIGKNGEWEFLPLDPSKKKGAVPTEYPVGFFTSATGVTIYTGDAYPDEFRGNAFIGDVGGNLVHRKKIDDTSVVYRAQRADEGVEFVRSRDNWFRPVNFLNGPDGAIYVLDMYRETVEHPYSIPDEIKQFLHLSSGDNRGRIYRLVSPKFKRHRRPPLGSLDNKQLVGFLDSKNGWTRRTAQRLLWERQDPSSVPHLSTMLRQADNPEGRLQVLTTLDGLNALTESHLLAGLLDSHPRVRSRAVRLSEPMLDRPAIMNRLADLAHDPSEHVRFQLAFSLGESEHPSALKTLATLARDPKNGAEIRTALLSSVGKTADQLALLLLRDKSRAQRHVTQYLASLGLIVGANSDARPAIRLLAGVSEGRIPLPSQQLIVTSLGMGLSRRGATLSELLQSEAASAEQRSQAARLFKNAAELAGDDKQTVAQRMDAVRLLAFADLDVATNHLEPLLSPRTRIDLQRAAVAALGQQPSDKVASLILAGWRGYSPQVRRDAIDALLTKPRRIATLLDAVEAGRVRRGEIERDKKQLLLKHPQAAIRNRSNQLFGSELVSDRAKVVKSFQDVLQLEGDAKRGLAVFKRKCSVCHFVDGVGHKVAPELASVQNKSASDLLIAILDPNREAQPNFNVYNVVTEQGRLFSGVIAAETENTITLRRAEAKEDVVLRSNIDQLTSTGASLMPEGLEKDLSRQDLADVIQLIRSQKARGNPSKK